MTETNVVPTTANQKNESIKIKEKFYFLECQICFESFLKKSLLTKHFEKKHSEHNQLVMKFGCLKCNKKFLTYPSIYQHKTVHSLKKSYHCSKCNYKTARKRDLNLHIHIKHNYSIQSFNCCNRIFTKKEKFDHSLSCCEKKKAFSSTFSLKSTLEHFDINTCFICGTLCPNFNFLSHQNKEKENISKQKESFNFDYDKNFKQRNGSIKMLSTLSQFSPDLRVQGESSSACQSSFFFECYACGEIFLFYKALESHFQEHKILQSNLILLSQ